MGCSSSFLPLTLAGYCVLPTLHEQFNLCFSLCGLRPGLCSWGARKFEFFQNSSIEHFTCCCIILEDLAHISQIPALGRNILNGTDRARAEILLDFLRAFSPGGCRSRGGGLILLQILPRPALCEYDGKPENVGSTTLPGLSCFSYKYSGRQRLCSFLVSHQFAVCSLVRFPRPLRAPIFRYHDRYSKNVNTLTCVGPDWLDNLVGTRLQGIPVVIRGFPPVVRDSPSLFLHPVHCADQ